MRARDTPRCRPSDCSASCCCRFYGIRSERQLIEQLDYNLLYRWFVGLSPDDPVWDLTTFSKNRRRSEAVSRLRRRPG
jgi:transposase